MRSAKLLMLMQMRVIDQVSLLGHIRFRCLHVHHSPERKIMERAQFAPSLTQSCAKMVEKKLGLEKPILCKITLKNMWSRAQWRKDSSYSPHREQTA